MALSLRSKEFEVERDVGVITRNFRKNTFSSLYPFGSFRFFSVLFSFSFGLVDEKLIQSENLLQSLKLSSASIEELRGALSHIFLWFCFGLLFTQKVFQQVSSCKNQAFSFFNPLVHCALGERYLQSALNRTVAFVVVKILAENFSENHSLHSIDIRIPRDVPALVFPLKEF